MPSFFVTTIAISVPISAAITMIIPVMTVVIVIWMIGRCCILLHIQSNRLVGLIGMLWLIVWTKGRCKNLLHSIRCVRMEKRHILWLKIAGVRLLNCRSRWNISMSIVNWMHRIAIIWLGWSIVFSTMCTATARCNRHCLRYGCFICLCRSFIWILASITAVRIAIPGTIIAIIWMRQTVSICIAIAIWMVEITWLRSKAIAYLWTNSLQILEIVNWFNIRWWQKWYMRLAMLSSWMLNHQSCRTNVHCRWLCVGTCCSWDLIYSK